MRELLDEICESLRGHLEFPSEGTVSGFDGVLREEDLKELPLPGAEEIPVISAVDGGSNAVLMTPTLAVVLNRVYYNQFLGMKKMEHCETAEFISKTEVVKKGGRTIFRTEVYPLAGGCPLDPMEIDTKDQSLMVGNMYGDMTRTVSIARRFCEWKMAERAVESGAECVLIDGALQTAFKGETEHANRLYQKAKERGAVVAGLSKSTTIYLESGYPVAGTVDFMARRKGYERWIIRLGLSEEWAHHATVYYTRLHEAADRGYRLDVFEDATGEQLDSLLRGLLACSSYTWYPGYPYPLIDAHTYAKVGNHEAESLKGQILDRLSPEEEERLELMERARAPHEVLDSLGG
ncbi:MAG: DNA double-strand break repair nuclease NurA [Candidatus Methanosuratincola sp.]